MIENIHSVYNQPSVYNQGGSGGGGGGGGLPAGYTQVQYIYNNSKGVITVTLDEETDDFVYLACKYIYRANENSDNKYLIGVVKSNDTEFLRVGVGTENSRMKVMLYNATSHSWNTNIGYTDSVTTNIHLLNNCGQFICNDLNLTHGEFGQYYNAAKGKAKYIALFGAYWNGSWKLGDSWCARQALVCVKLFGLNSNKLLLDLVPCKNDYNAPGFYDVVNNKFYGASINAGDIHAGPDVV